MSSTVGRILKSHDVKVEGQFRLNMNEAGPDKTQHINSVLAEPKVRIVDSQSEFAVIEVICSCGAKISLKCEYGNTQAGEG